MASLVLLDAATLGCAHDGLPRRGGTAELRAFVL